LRRRAGIEEAVSLMDNGKKIERNVAEERERG